MTLVEAGQVRLDDHIGAYLNNLPANWREITIRQLLGHTSGLPDVIDGASEPLAATPEEALRLLEAKPMDFVPGSKWAYNQTNYLLLSLMIEKVSGEPFEKFCKMRLFAPLNLTTPSFGLQRVIEHRASLYTDIIPNSGPPPKHLDHLELSTGKMVPMLYSAGGLNISIEDFAHWLIAVLDGKIISRASLETLWTPAPLSDGSRFENYGLGWWLVPRGSHPEAGGNGGARAAFAVYRQDDLAVVVVTNLQGSEATSLVEGVAKKYLQRSLKWPSAVP